MNRLARRRARAVRWRWRRWSLLALPPARHALESQHERCRCCVQFPLLALCGFAAGRRPAGALARRAWIAWNAYGIAGLFGDRAGAGAC